MFLIQKKPPSFIRTFIKDLKNSQPLKDLKNSQPRWFYNTQTQTSVEHNQVPARSV